MAVYQLDKSTAALSTMSKSQLEQLPNVGKSIAAAIFEISTTGKYAELEKLLESTPKGVVEMLAIKGVGPKKIRTLWKEGQIDSLLALKQACTDGSILKFKGFGEKLVEEIIEYLNFKENSKGKFFYADVEILSQKLEESLQNALAPIKVALVGDVKRKMEIGEKLSFIAGHTDATDIFSKINSLPDLNQDLADSSPFIWRGIVADSEIKVEIKVYDPKKFESEKYLQSAGNGHLQHEINGSSIRSFVKVNTFENEAEIFQKLNLPPIPPECREGLFEFNEPFPRLLEDSDLKGIFHNHTTYSDGEHTLQQMADYCRELGYEYLGISDHSKTANYAGGLKEEDIIRQHKEIDELNSQMKPFKIFKGIESDILGDGSLDYVPEVLATFDYIVASIHANLKMDADKATQRLITAIENPYTTMLGHPTGRLLLSRQGYPIHHSKVIDACAANKVIIEINANPWRLDLDWRWVHYALEKGVILSINPDAHEMAGYLDMHYGVCVGRKGGLTPEMTFNTWTLAQVEKYFGEKKY